MQCNECKWFSIGANDHYGVCKRFPENQNKNRSDFCGEFNQKEVAKPIEIVFTEPTKFTEDGKVKVVFTEEKPKRGRKPKNAS